MANNNPPGIKITGIRGSIPSGYLLGRSAPGSGDVQLLTLKAMQSVGLAPVTLPPSGAAGGDLSGTYPNPTVAKINGRAVAGALPSNLNVLAWNTAGLTWQALALATVAYTGAYSDLTGLPSIHSIPAGGTAGQALTKVDGTDYNVAWTTISSGSGGAASIYDDGTNIYMGLVDGDGLMVLDGSGLGIYSVEVFPLASIPTMDVAHVVGVTGRTSGVAIPAGQVGEVVESEILLAAAVTLATGTANTITSLVLQPGVWSVIGMGINLPGAGCNQTVFVVGIMLSTGNPATAVGCKGALYYNALPGTDLTMAGTVGGFYLNVSVATTVYLRVISNFTVASQKAYGYLSALRIA